MSQIAITKLNFAYEGSYDNIFENVSFQMDTDWKLGFTGRNGRGKTTFLRLLLGEYEFWGQISASVDFSYFPYPVAAPERLTAQIVAEICPGSAPWELLRELSLLEVNEEVLDRPFESLSYGERTKVLLAALFLRENNFLLIDEPTNHLDMGGRAILSRYLQGQKGFILVSHDRVFLDSCIDHILSINRTNIEIQRGNFSSWLQNKQRQDNFELAENNKRQKEIRHLTQASQRTSIWSDKVEKSKSQPLKSGVSADKGYIGHKAAKMMKRAKGMEDRRQAAIEAKAGLLKNVENTESLKIPIISYHAARLVMLKDVSIVYGGKTVCQGLSFTIEQGDRIALCGKNGSGKSSVIKLICGEDVGYTGELQVGSRLNISYVSQDTSFLRGALSDYARQNSLDESLLKAILRKLDFTRVQFDKEIQAFSEGQKKKVLIAKSLCEKAHLYIWDEPLNFIDIFSRMQIEALLLDYKPTILFVEHDRAFCDNVATKRVEL